MASRKAVAETVPVLYNACMMTRRVAVVLSQAISSPSPSPMVFNREEHPRHVLYSEQLHQLDDLDFLRNMRMSKETYGFILDMVNQRYSHVYRGGHFPLGAQKALEVTLWYLGNRATYREIAELFGISKSAVHICVGKIIVILNDLARQFVKWPTGEREAETEREFCDIAGFPGVIGALDGSHIQIKAPDEMKADYINREQTHSINLLAVCDARKRFTYIDSGFCGCAHDSRIFSTSAFYHQIINHRQSLFSSTSHHIIGDSAFQLSSFFLVPYRDTGNLTRAQRSYNHKHSQTRMVIENAFGWLKGRFRRLKYVDADVAKIPKIVTACCVLHNITLKFPAEEELLLHEGEIEGNDYANLGFNDIRLPADLEGNEKRNFITTLL